MFSGADRGRAFGVLGTTVGLGTAIGPLVGGALIALGGPTLGLAAGLLRQHPGRDRRARPLARRFLPAADRHHPPPARRARGRPPRRRDVLRPLRLRGVRRAPRRPARLAGGADRRRWSACSCAGSAGSPRPTATRWSTCGCSSRPSYVSGITLALAFFPAMAGLPLVLALYYQRGLGYTALESGSGSRPTPSGARSPHPLTGRVVTRIGRPLVVAGAVTFGAGRGGAGRGGAARARGARDPGAGRTAVRDGLRPGGGDHAQPDAGADGRRPADGQHRRWRAADRPTDRAGDRPGPDRRGLLQLADRDSPATTHAPSGNAVIAAICFVSIAVAIGVHDLVRARRRESLV